MTEQVSSATDSGSPTPLNPEILDACCGGRCWWWDKRHPLAVYMDNRVDDEPLQKHASWRCAPDVVGDFRAIPFDDHTFFLVLFDPPHIVRQNPSGRTVKAYGVLDPDTEQNDLRQGFSECWRVLTPGGTLVFKWAGKLDRVKPHFPLVPIVGTRQLQAGKSGLGTRWFIFYKPLNEHGSGNERL